VALAEASRPGFALYAQRIVDNATALAEGLLRRGAALVTGGTDNHLVLLDTRPWGLTGRQCEAALLEAGIVTNRNSIPADPHGPWYTTGVRLGTPALTTLGMGPAEMDEIAELITTVAHATTPATTASGDPSRARYHLEGALARAIRSRTQDLLAAHPLYPGINLE